MKSLAVITCSIFLSAASLQAAETDNFTAAEAESITSFLNEHIGPERPATVVGLVDQQGSKIFSAGALDNGTELPVNGDTVFFIGSVTKTFTALLLLDMVERG